MASFQFASVIAEIMRYSKPMDDVFTCVNGAFVRADEAVLPVADRGLRFGDGVFETILLHHGVPYDWENHYARLLSGLIALRIPVPEVDFKAHVKALLQRNNAHSGSVRLSVTRGVGSKGYLPTGAQANWVIEIIPATTISSASCRLWLSAQRRIPLSCLPMNEKLAQGVGSTLALLEAQDHECDDALQLSTSGVIACAASGNVGWIKGRRIFTPALSTGCLRGTTRARLMELSPYPMHECSEEMNALETADAVFLCNSRVGVWPIAVIEPLGLRFSIDHPILAELNDLIHSNKESYFNTNKLYWLDK